MLNKEAISLITKKVNKFNIKLEVECLHLNPEW